MLTLDPTMGSGISKNMPLGGLGIRNVPKFNGLPSSYVTNAPVDVRTGLIVLPTVQLSVIPPKIKSQQTMEMRETAPYALGATEGRLLLAEEKEKKK